MPTPEAPIVVINPNSTAAITDGLTEALGVFGGTEIRCITLTEGPAGIETDAHIAEVEQPLVARIRSEDRDAAAFVVACFSDPGLAAARKATGKPVFGIARSGLMTACSVAERIGVVSILEASVTRHRALYEELGLSNAIAGDRPLGLHVTELRTHPDARTLLLDVGRSLVRDGAGAIVLGCTGLSGYRAWLESELRIPVVDPTVAAVAMAIGMRA